MIQSRECPVQVLLQLRKHITVLTPSLIGKMNVKGREHEAEVIGDND
jgi:hypothetical protein